MRFSVLLFLLSMSAPCLAGDPPWLRLIETPTIEEPKPVDPLPELPEVSFLGLDDGVEVIPFSGPIPLSRSMVEVRFLNVVKRLSLPLHGYREGLKNEDLGGIGGAVRVPIPFVVSSVGGVKVENRGSFVSDGIKVYEGAAGNWSVYEVHHSGYKIVGVFRSNESLGVIPKEESRLRAIEEFNEPIESPSELTPATADAKPTHVATHLVVYSASWCGPCQRVKPKFLKLKSLGYRVEIRDYDKIPKGDYKPRSVPEIHLFNGKSRVSGHGLNAFSSIEDFKKKLELPLSDIEA